jgi:hypothetical protein
MDFDYSRRFGLVHAGLVSGPICSFALVETAFFPGLDLGPDLLAQIYGEQGG